VEDTSSNQERGEKGRERRERAREGEREKVVSDLSDMIKE
jgi:hypothetical protein